MSGGEKSCEENDIGTAANISRDVNLLDVLQGLISCAGALCVATLANERSLTALYATQRKTNSSVHCSSRKLCQRRYINLGGVNLQGIFETAPSEH